MVLDVDSTGLEDRGATEAEKISFQVTTRAENYTPLEAEGPSTSETERRPQDLAIKKGGINKKEKKQRNETKNEEKLTRNEDGRKKES